MAQGVSGRDVPGNAGGLYVSPGDGGAAESDRATGMPGLPDAQDQDSQKNRAGKQGGHAS